ncbi:hypothetical protein JZ751_016549 [Albula glossodonta]|uniref:Uncharacterized protein n=1 Tax=Albula glossodonta TaxID=121402 RepID=A0A8T2MIS3_9TELE|nr:hypothetical protein JZ751_016549 [Albula glossodonta]
MSIMDQDTPEEVLAEFKDSQLGGWGLLQITASTGLAVYAVWAGLLMPGFRRVPLKLQVPYLPASRKQVSNVMALLKGRAGGLTDLGSGDGRIPWQSGSVPQGSGMAGRAFCCRKGESGERTVLTAYRLGFHPAVGYELNPWLVRLSYFHAWRAGLYGKVSYLRRDLWKVSLADCKNVTVFLAPSVVSTC